MFSRWAWTAVFFLLSCALGAQQTANYASVTGRVTDVTGAAVAGADIAIERTATRQTTSAETDANGAFHFGYLAPGAYRLTVSKPGFAASVQALTLSVGSAFELPIVLRVAQAQTEITVEAAPPVIEAARSQVAGSVSSQQIVNLPMPGRNYLDLALLVPGVAPANTGSTQTFAETSAVPGQGISIGSQRNFSNSFIVDGLSANDDAAGLANTFYDQDVVDQFQVVTAGGQAEFGRALGGYVSMITKSGTGTLHGDAYGYFGNQRLNANNALTGSKLPMTLAQYGASLGGPIGKDAFYFANFERRELNQTGVITITPANVAAANAILDADAYAGPRLATGLYPDPIHSSNAFGRLDKNFGSNDQFTARYSLYRVNSPNSRGVGGLSALSAGAGLKDDDQTLAVANVHVLSANSVNEVRAQLTYDNLSAPVNDPVGPAVSIAGVASFGRLSVSPTARHNWLFEAVDNFSHQAGAHALKFGTNFLYNDLRIVFPQAARGSYSFASLDAFRHGVYNGSGFTQAFGAPVVDQTNPNVGVYAQDSWTASPSLTINAGLRYDLQFLRAVATDTNNVSPRVGFAWVPFADRRTVVRGSLGVYYDRVPLRALSNALQSSGNTTLVTPATFVTASLSPQQAGAPAFPGVLTSQPAGVLVNFTTMDPHMQQAYAEQGGVQVERQIGPRSAVSVGYQHVRGVRLIIDVNRNPPTCVASGGNNGCRANPAYGNNKQYSPLANSQYDALTAGVQWRPAWGSVHVAYTLSKALDNVGEFFFSGPVDNFDIWKDWGRSSDDQRQRLVVDAVLNSPTAVAAGTWQRLWHDWQLSGTVAAYSPLPFNIVTGASTVQGTAARPLGPNGTMIARNTGTGFGSLSVNARLSRTWTLPGETHLEAMLEGYNALNHPNSLFPNATFGTGAYPTSPLASFGQATAVGDPRSVQLALRVSF